MWINGLLLICSQDKEPRGIIPLENLSIREVEEPRKPVCFYFKLSVKLYSVVSL